MNVAKSVIIYFVALIALNNSAVAETTSSFSGTGYADYYNYLQNQNSDVEGENAFQYRRIYFTYENYLSSNIKVRVRLESKHEDFGTKAE